MTREDVNALAVDMIIECDYGYGIVTSIEEVERESLKEQESDSDFITVVYVDGVYNDSGCWNRTGESEMYLIDELLADEFKVVE